MRTIWAPVAVITGCLLLGAAGSVSADRRNCDRTGQYQYVDNYRYYPADWNSPYDQYDRGYGWDRSDIRAGERWRLEEARRHQREEELEEARERAHARWERARARDRDWNDFRRDQWSRDRD
jgi:hypothetical protein